MAQIRVQQLHKAFAAFTAVKDSTFTVRDGEFFCLLGPSGCGKTTTLRMIAGLELPTSGQIFLGDEDVSFKRASARDIAFVFQMFALYPHMNVRQNIAFPLVTQGMPRAEIDRRVMEAARTLRITELLGSSVSGLSSGDRQRVALGRAIVRQPLAFLMDEPLGALDAEFREVMCHELRALHDRLGATTVYVTHDQTEAMSMADTIAVMNNGLIEQLGAPMDVYERPASVFVADFIGSPSMNFLPFDAALSVGADVIQIGGAVVSVPALREDVPMSKLLCGVRPEHVRFADDSKLRAQVVGTEYLGTSQIITVTTDVGGMLRAKVSADSTVTRGDHVGLRFDAGAVSLFDQVSGRALRTARDDAGIQRQSRSKETHSAATHSAGTLSTGATHG
jgi:multiple sugar transport system ATP-binding protein